MDDVRVERGTTRTHGECSVSLVTVIVATNVSLSLTVPSTAGCAEPCIRTTWGIAVLTVWWLTKPKVHCTTRKEFVLERGFSGRRLGAEIDRHICAAGNG
jgi:hypothetical protein